MKLKTVLIVAVVLFVLYVVATSLLQGLLMK